MGRAARSRAAGRVGAVALALALLLPCATHAADQDVQLWTVGTIEHRYEKWKPGLQLRIRVDEDIGRADDFLVRPFASFFPLDSLEISTGYDHLHPFRSGDRHENRFWQSVEYSRPFEEVIVDNRFRHDARWVEDVGGAVHRLRHRLRFGHPIAKRWEVLLANEVFVNANSQGEGPIAGFEQNRVRLTLQWDRLPVRLEGSYEWIYQERRDDIAIHKHVFLVSFLLRTGDPLKVLPEIRRRRRGLPGSRQNAP